MLTAGSFQIYTW